MENKNFYKKANEMQDGWGDYLKKIDLLYEKLNKNVAISDKEACWILYAEYIGNFIDRKKFMQWVRKELPNKMFTWQIWKSLFCGWRLNSR